MIITDLLILSEPVKERQLRVLCIERSPLIPSLSHYLRDNLARDLLVFLYFFKVDGAVLGWGMRDAEFGLISDLADLPLFVSL